MRRRELLALAASGALTTAAIGGIASPAQADPLDKYRWERRLVLLFAPLKLHPHLVVQRGWLKDVSQGLSDRDMTVVEVVNNSVSVDGRPTLEINGEALRREFGPSIVEFGILLIGKDGGVKLRSDEPQTADRLFEIVDAMPMRRQEMRQRKQDKTERRS
ncbi:MAG: DUF4174 domain-containing protein [Alphaproteobacteria bacterium]|nr:DUF4174 domain-containing protein [Alphaproteobacteria bacterium]